MSKLNTVTLEFIRKGNPHNQLLSPLTEYYSICGNHGTKVVHVKWEHRQFLSEVKKLLYPRSRTNDPDYMKQRRNALEEMAVDISKLFAKVTGLNTGITSTNSGTATQLTHLRLVVSASELAMLPFELTKNIEGVPGGQDNWLSLQSTNPVCITRRVRDVTPIPIDWTTQPRVLFIASSAGGRIPFEKHLQALVNSVKPWVKDFSDDDKKMRKETDKWITILKDATIEKIYDACKDGKYTHIHLLAHGEQDKTTLGDPFGVALHLDKNPSKVNIVTGDRFAKAICPGGAHPGPAVVTVATCNSGNINSVIDRTGASFAQDLHREGIPLVVASQFPLTFSGSIMMVEKIYGNLLWGEEPIGVIHELRSKLYSLKSSENHDWASLVVYESLEEDLEDDLTRLQYEQTRRAINQKLDRADNKVAKYVDAPELTTTFDERDIDGFFKSIDRLVKKFPDHETYEAEVKGLHASTEKRKAGLYFRIDNMEKSYYSLIKARCLYGEAVDIALRSRKQVESSPHWVITQYINLSAVLREHYDMGYWHAAKQSAEIDIRATKDQLIWANGSLAELYLLLLAYNGDDIPISMREPNEIAIKASEHARNVKELSVLDPFPVDSTLRQLRRYKDWWWSDVFQAFLDRKLNIVSDDQKKKYETMLGRIELLCGELGENAKGDE